MTRARPLGLVLLLTMASGLIALIGPAAYPSGTTRHTQTQDVESATIRLANVAPATLPTKGPLTLTGSVTNTSSHTLHDVNAIPFIGATAITTRDELDEAARESTDAYVGDRLVTPKTTVDLGDLAPGQAGYFRIRIPQAELGNRSAGVYWIGVHARAAGSGGVRETVARARAFIASRPGGNRTVAPVFSLRYDVARDASGRVADPAQLVKLLSPSGQLGHLVAFGGTTPPASGSWIVDPALLQAASDLANGNPPVQLAHGDTDGGPSPGSGGGSGAASPWDGKPSEKLSPAQRAVAKAWLGQAIGLLRSQTTLVLPYGDVDVSALARHRPRLLQLAQQRSKAWMATHDISVTPIVAPPDGWLAPAALDALDRRTVLLLTDHDDVDQQALSLAGGHVVLRADTATATGGPSPTPALAPLAVRQRMLAAAALRSGSSSDGSSSGEPQGPLVVSLPSTWDPGTATGGLYPGLAQPWLTLVTLDSAATASDGAEEVVLPYPASARRLEIGPAGVNAAMTLVRDGTQLDQLVGAQGALLGQLYGVALPSVSYPARADPGGSLARTRGFVDQSQGLLGRVRVTGTDLVTLSGLDGTVTVSLVNGLPVPITVGLDAKAEGVHVASARPQRIAAGRRQTFRLAVHARRIGVHQVELMPVTTAGRHVGDPQRFTLRISKVGQAIWWALLAAVLLFVVTVGRRLRQRMADRGDGEPGSNPSRPTEPPPAEESRDGPADPNGDALSSSIGRGATATPARGSR